MLRPVFASPFQRPDPVPRRPRPAAALLLLLLLLGWLELGSLHAHPPGLSYLNLLVESNRITGRVDMSLNDLDLLIGLDLDGNGSVTLRELQAKQPAIGGLLRQQLRFTGDGREGLLHVQEHQVASDNDGVYAVANIEVTFDVPPAGITLENRLFRDANPAHRSLVQLQAGTAPAQTAMFAAGTDHHTFRVGDPRPPGSLPVFLREGVHHIWEGHDHILFLVALLLPAVVAADGRGWQPVSAFRPACLHVVKIVTAFTVAHSLTLSLAALGWVRLPGRLVESVIAASVILAAANNLRPFFRGHGWFVAFTCGIIHGFGFASVLGDLNVPANELPLALLGFNLGVEAGQLAIVAGFLPLAYALRRTEFYRRGLLQAGSVVIVAVAALWLVQRVFDL